KTGVTTEEAEKLVSETSSFSKTTKISQTTTVTSTSATTEITTEISSSYSAVTTETQTVTEQSTEVINEISQETEPVTTEIHEESLQPETENFEKYSDILNEINVYQDRFFEYVKIKNDSTNGMIEMCRGMDVNEHFEGEEREKFLEFSSFADEYEKKVYDLFAETEEILKSFENNPYYDYYVRAEKDLADNNYGAPQGTYVGSVQQWYAINGNYDRLIEYLMSELEKELPSEAFGLIRQSETEWVEKHDYFLDNVIIYNGNQANPSTGEFEAQSRKYRCLMLMMYYCKTI
ncbi:MAG: hypothetical protein K2O29_00335, partial [Ruminococcus sp.]|nr:hypothetical protein [Ruminococcus sp.]